MLPRPSWLKSSGKKAAASSAPDPQPPPTAANCRRADEEEAEEAGQGSSVRRALGGLLQRALSPIVGGPPRHAPAAHADRGPPRGRQQPSELPPQMDGDGHQQHHQRAPRQQHHPQQQQQQHEHQQQQQQRRRQHHNDHQQQQQQQKQQLQRGEQQHPPPSGRQQATASAGEPAASSSCHLTAKTSDNQCALHGQQQQQRATPPTPEQAGAAPQAPPLAASSGGGHQRQRRQRPRRRRRLAPWPLAKEPVGRPEAGAHAQASSFGDCEDIASPHLSGRLAGGGHTKEGGCLVAATYHHRRPFARPFEAPATGWMENSLAARAGRMDGRPKEARIMAPPPTSARTSFRRWSYDDREGDKDITIILQPSDLHDIERRAKERLISKQPANRRRRNSNGKKGQTGTNSANNNNNTSNNNNLADDLKLAKCLLDQDYNLTVRLFIRDAALNWNFNSFTFDALCCGRSLTELLLHLFDYYNLYKLFNLDIVNVLKCFHLLEFNYHSTNPYHNSIHAADVTQAMHCFIQENKIRRHMTDLEILCSIMAAVCHDLDHPGVNQSFLVATNNPLASLYNNSSVLENHHWRFALCIFKETQLFDHFDKETMEEFKNQLKHLILATDIARQNEYLKRFKDLTSSREFSMQNTEDRALVLQMALKCADLGNPCRPWIISRVWSNLICDEFYNMGKIERQLGIPLTPICQREKTSIAGIQTDFFRFIVSPLLELWHRFLQSPLSNLLMSNFEHNYQRWQRANRMIQQLKRRKSVACV